MAPQKPVTTESDLITSTTRSATVTISSVPNEILTRILAYTMASDMPVHLQHIFKLGRTAHSNDPSYDDIDQDYQFRTHLLSRDWWFSQLDPSQKGHFVDWLLINGTCRRFRAFGKPVFFSEKMFLISPPFLSTLQDNNTRNLTAADTATAIKCISHVVAPLRTVSAASSFLGLVRYQRILPRLRNLSIQPRAVEYEILPALNAGTMASHEPPKTLMDLLGKIGLDTDRIHVRLVYADDEDTRQHNIACLHDQVYPYLRIVADRRKKVKP